MGGPSQKKISVNKEALQKLRDRDNGLFHQLDSSTNGLFHQLDCTENVKQLQKVESTTHSMDLKTGRIVFKPKKKDSSLPAKDERVQMKSKHS